MPPAAKRNSKARRTGQAKQRGRQAGWLAGKEQGKKEREKELLAAAESRASLSRLLFVKPAPASRPARLFYFPHFLAAAFKIGAFAPFMGRLCRVSCLLASVSVRSISFSRA